MLVVALAGALLLVLAAAVAVAAYFRRVSARAGAGVVPAMATAALRHRAREGEPGAAMAARVIDTLRSDRAHPNRAVSAEQIRAGLEDPEPVRARFGAQGTPRAYAHARVLDAYARDLQRGRVASLVVRALADAENTASASRS